MSDHEGFVRIPSDKPQWLPILRDLYRFEQTKVAGPGSHKRRFSDVAWTRQEAINHLNLPTENISEFDELIAELAKNRQIMVVKANKNKIKTINKYFDFNLSNIIKKKINEFNFIIARNVIAHVPKPNEIFKASDQMVDSLTNLIGNIRKKN